MGFIVTMVYILTVVAAFGMFLLICWLGDDVDVFTLNYCPHYRKS